MNLSKLGCAGFLVIVTVLSMIIPTYADATTITPSSADATISGSSPNWNWGTDANLEVYSGIGIQPRHSLVKFDLSSIPPGSAINLAYLQLYYFTWDSQAGPQPVGKTFTANRVTSNWVEGTLDGNPPPPPGATWLTYDGTSNWGTAGGDFTTTGAASHTLIAGDLGNYVTWDVTTIVKAWIEGGQANYGFLIEDQNEGTGANTGALFYSRDAGPTHQLPILKIDYTPRVIPEYPLGLPLLAIFMLFAYGIIRRRTRNPESI